MGEVRGAIGTFVRQSLGDEPLGDTDDIFTAGFVDSLFSAQLAAFIHQRFGLRINPDEFGAVSSIADIASLVERRASAAL